MKTTDIGFEKFEEDFHADLNTAFIQCTSSNKYDYNGRNLNLKSIKAITEELSTIEDEPKYKKKSTAKGQPRSKHKHIYETVLLTTKHEFNFGEQRISYSSMPTKVCTICGRIDDVVWDKDYYTETKVDNITFVAYSKELSEKASSLPKWHCNFFDKFAVKDE